jgi:hypothetical protein
MIKKKPFLSMKEEKKTETLVKKKKFKIKAVIKNHSFENEIFVFQF